MNEEIVGVKFIVGEHIDKEELPLLLNILKGMDFTVPKTVKDGYYYIRFCDKSLFLTCRANYDSLALFELHGKPTGRNELMVVLSKFLEDHYNGYKFSLGEDTKEVSDTDLNLFFSMLMRKGWGLRGVLVRSPQRKYFFLDCEKKVVGTSDSVKTYVGDKTKYKLPGHLILGLMDRAVEEGNVEFNLSNILVIHERIRKSYKERLSQEAVEISPELKEQTNRLRLKETSLSLQKRIISNKKKVSEIEAQLDCVKGYYPLPIEQIIELECEKSRYEKGAEMLEELLYELFPEENPLQEGKAEAGSF